MKSSFEFLGIASLFTSKKEHEVELDPTTYKIETCEREYEGQILFQDNKLIVLKTEGYKVVRVLKQDILKMK